MPEATAIATEVILALGATVDGVPVGGALDVLDDGALSAALRSRRPV